MKLSVFSPVKCALCNYHACYDRLPICEGCLYKLQQILTEKCRFCGQTATACGCVGDVRSMMFFNNYPSRMLMYMVKCNCDKRVIRFLTEMAVNACGINPKRFDGVTYVPRLPRARRRYGYDQSKEMAKAISEVFGIPLVSCLKRVGGREQKLLSKGERIKNTRNKYIPKNFPEEKFNRLLLVDDVVTTGATTTVCKDILHQHFAKSVTILTLAKTVSNKKPSL